MKLKIELIMDDGRTCKDLAAQCRKSEQCPIETVFCPFGKDCEKIRSSDWKGFAEKGMIYSCE